MARSSFPDTDTSTFDAGSDEVMPRQAVDLDLQNQSITLISLLAMHPRPHLALRRFRDLVDAWHQQPTEQSLLAALRARPGRFPMNLDQVMQSLMRADDPSVPTLPAGPVEPHNVWQAADSSQQMHDLFVMALLATHTTPDLIAGQFRTLLERLGKSPVSTTLDAEAFVAVRRSAMRFDRIVKLVTSARDEQPCDTAVSRERPQRPVRIPRGQTARFLLG